MNIDDARKLILKNEILPTDNPEFKFIEETEKSALEVLLGEDNKNNNRNAESAFLLVQTAGENYQNWGKLILPL